MSEIFGLLRKKKVDIDLDFSFFLNVKKKKFDYVNSKDIFPVVFGHKMLYSTPESLSELLPILDKNNHILLTSDARIDNRKELFKILFSKSICEKNISDSELILAAYKKWKYLCVNHLIGDYAFAIYDFELDELFCARDKMGIKPFYYHKNDEYFAFSSSIQHLFKLPDYKKTINFHSYTTNFNPSSTIGYGQTMFSQIQSLPPGHFMIIKDMKNNITRYWEPEKIKIDHSISLEEARIKYYDLLKEAVQCRLRSAYPIAIELSGGLDSSSIVTLTKHLNPLMPISLYTMRFGNYRCDEGKYSKAIAKEVEYDHKQLRIDLVDFQNKYSLNNIYKNIPDFPIEGTTAQAFPMFEEMQKNKIRVLLTGHGGDHISTGNLYVLADYFKSFQWNKLWKLYKNNIFEYTSKELTFNYLIIPLLKASELRIIKKLLRWMYRTFKKINNQDNYTKELENKGADYSLFDSIYQYHEVDMINGLFHANWSDYNVYQKSNNYQIDARHPFFDSRLVEYTLSLPAEYKISNSELKLILKEAMRDLLPEIILKRNDKADFYENINDQIKAIDLDIFWEKAYIVELGLLTQEELSNVIKKYKESDISDLQNESIETKWDKIGYIYELWRLIGLESWYRYHSL